jgi:hypothetical protein
VADQGTPRKTQEPDNVRALAKKLADVEKAVATLGKSATLRNASISGGDGLTVKDADEVIRLRISTDEAAIIAYDTDGTEVARYGLLAHSDPGQYGLEVLSGSWVHVGAQVATWANLSGKPATFAPSAHNHPGGDITSAVASATSATTAGLASQAEGSQYAYDNNVGGTTWYAVYVGNNGGYKFGRNTSSIRYKENVRDFVGDVSDLMALRPVIFDRKPTMGDAPTWTDPATGEVLPAEGPVQMFEGNKDEYGFIAEEVNQVWPEIIQWYDHGDGLGPQIDGIRYELIGARLVPILQGMLQWVRAARSRVDNLETAGQALRTRVKALEDAAVTSRATATTQANLIADLTRRLEQLEQTP